MDDIEKKIINETRKIVYRKDDKHTIIEIDDYKDKNTILNMAMDMDVYLLKEEYQSKYNTYVVYDYEPFCVDSFIVRLYFDGTSFRTPFFIHILKQYYDNIDKLEKIYNLKEYKA